MTLLLTTVFAVLTIVVWAGALAAGASPAMRDRLRPHAVAAGSMITGTATLGSLYLSEVAGYVPCELCWVQRIFAYSLAVILTVAVIRQRNDVWGYAVPLAALGLATSAWHVVVQRFPAAGATCDPSNPCSAVWVERFGVITIPVMAGTAFLGVLVLALLVRGHTVDPTEPTPVEKEPVA